MPLQDYIYHVCACPIPNVSHSYCHLTREGLLLFLPHEETEALKEWDDWSSPVTHSGKPHSAHPLYTCFLAFMFRWQGWYAEVMTNKLHTPYSCKTFTIYNTLFWPSLAAPCR